MDESWVVTVVAGLFGLTIGSFLNVCSLRWPIDESVVSPGSHCPGRLEEAGVDQAMGGGDVKMMMMVGAYVGLWGVAQTIFLGSVLALLVFGPVATLSKRLIPLGVFLAAAAAVAYTWGQPILEWYMTSVVGLPG